MGLNIQKDKQLHFLYSFYISCLFGIFFVLIGMNIFQVAIASFSVAFAAGLGKEYGDKINPYNKWDWYDILADALGSLVGVIIPIIIKIIF